jgi:hypothetical protein
VRDGQRVVEDGAVVVQPEVLGPSRFVREVATTEGTDCVRRSGMRWRAPGDVGRALRRLQVPRVAVVGVLVTLAALAVPVGRSGVHDVVGARQLTYLDLAFANRDSGAVVASLALARRRCAVALFSTTDGAASWSSPVVFAPGAPCPDEGLDLSLAVSSTDRWWALVSGRLYSGMLASSRATRVVLATVDGSPCSVVASGTTVDITAGTSCFAPSMLVASLDSGAHWRAARLPIALTGVAPTLTSPDDFLAVGWRGRPPKGAGTRSELVALQRGGDGTWRTSPLPCVAGRAARTAWSYGFAASASSRVMAVCFSGLEAVSAGALEVVASSDGGRQWQERCGKGTFGFANFVGSCPGYGLVSGLGLERDGVAVMTLDQVGVLTSKDDGRTWQSLPSEPQGDSFDELSTAGTVIWAMQTSPPLFNFGGWLAVSSDGLHWQREHLPT